MEQKFLNKGAEVHRKIFSGLVALLLALLASCMARSQATGTSERWVSAWSTAVHAPVSFPGLPPPPIFQDQTIRMVIRPEMGGDRLRLRFSNEFGSTPLRIGAAHVALSEQGSRIVPGSDHVVTFHQAGAVEIPAGAPLVSDSVAMSVKPFTELAVTLYIAGPATASTIHLWAQHDIYIAGPGDLTAQAELTNPKVTTSWYWLAGLEVQSAAGARATVAFGDSITDGAGVKQGNYEDWPDRLAQRAASTSVGSGTAILNEGIGGNRILYDGAGVSALARLDRDVLSNAGVRNLIVLEGINDIGWPSMKPPASMSAEHPGVSPFAGQRVTAGDLITGLEQIILRAHEHEIRVYGATMTPYEGANYYTPEGEAIREEVNQWIRSSGAFDAVIDFDAAVRDPQQPQRFVDRYQSGDHLHPSAAGYQAMADAVNLTLLQ
jgi:lysophospholipase L1-like esterase